MFQASSAVPPPQTRPASRCSSSSGVCALVPCTAGVQNPCSTHLIRTLRSGSASVKTRSVPRAARYASRLLPSRPINSISHMRSLPVLLLRLALPLIGQAHHALQIRQAIPAISASQPPESFAHTRTYAFQSVIASRAPVFMPDLHRFGILHNGRERQEPI